MFKYLIEDLTVSPVADACNESPMHSTLTFLHTTRRLLY